MQRCCGNTIVKFVGETEIQIHHTAYSLSKTLVTESAHRGYNVVLTKFSSQRRVTVLEWNSRLAGPKKKKSTGKAQADLTRKAPNGELPFRPWCKALFCQRQPP